jgi:hypothetical protein
MKRVVKLKLNWIQGVAGNAASVLGQIPTPSGPEKRQRSAALHILKRFAKQSWTAVALYSFLILPEGDLIHFKSPRRQPVDEIRQSRTPLEVPVLDRVDVADAPATVGVLLGGE